MKKILWVAALCCLAPLYSGEPAMIMNASGRDTVQSLNGQWGFIPDPYETGYFNYRRQPSDWGYFRNAKMRKPSDLIEYDFSKSWKMRVPGDWNTQRPEMWMYEGSAWYGREFNAAVKKGKRYFLRFGAIAYFGRVWLNGEKLGEHEGGFTPVEFEVTGKIKDGKNFVAVMVDNLRREEGVPTVATDWWNYGGLTREVSLLEEPQTFIRDWSLGLDGGRHDRLAGWVRLDGPGAAGAEVDLNIKELGVRQKVKTDRQGRAVFRIEAGPVLWQPGKAKLYEVKIAAGQAKAMDRIGFRTVEVQGRDILVNGKPVFLRGISIHEEAAGKKAGRAYSAKHARELLGWAKELGCNFVRLAHYPHNEAMLREADRMGLMVWEEIPVYWTIAWKNKKTLANARAQLKAMIERDRNRAATILWSVGNETPLSPERLEFMTTLVKDVKRLDPGRLVTAALEQHAVDEQTRMIDDPLGKYLDVLGLNEYLGWYDRLPGEFDALKWKTIYDKPLVISEFGAGAKKGMRGKRLDRWTEDYQAAVYEDQLAMLEKVPFLRGMTPWILKDFLSPRRPLPQVQDFFNRKGLLSETGQKKKAFYVLRDWYRKKAGQP